MNTIKEQKMGPYDVLDINNTTVSEAPFTNTALFLLITYRNEAAITIFFHVL